MKNEKGFLSSVWKAQGKATKWLSLGGLLLWGFLTKAAVTADTLNPNPGLLDIGTQFYTVAGGTFIENIVPGTEIILSAAFRLVTDFIVPGAGTALGAITDTAALAI